MTLSLSLLQNYLMLINTILVERTIERQDLWRRRTSEDFCGITPCSIVISIPMEPSILI